MNSDDQVAFAKLIDSYDSSLRVNPHFSEAYNNRGAIKHALGDFFGAIADYDQAIAIKAGYAEAYNNRGASRHAVGNLTGALQDFNRALEINPKYSDAYHNRGAAYYDQKEFHNAITDYGKALDLRENSAHCDLRRIAMIHVFRGDAHYHNGNTHEGLDDYRVAFTINSDISSRILIRGLARDCLKSLEWVLSDCERHIKNDPKDFVSHVRRSLVLLLNHRDLEAQAGFDLFAARHPEDREIIVEPLIQRAILHRAADGV